MTWSRIIKPPRFRFRLASLFAVMALAGLIFSVFNPLYKPPPKAQPITLFNQFNAGEVSAAFDAFESNFRSGFADWSQRSRADKDHGHWEMRWICTPKAPAAAAKKAICDLEERLRQVAEKSGATISESRSVDTEMESPEFCFYYELGKYHGRISGRLNYESKGNELVTTPHWRLKLWHQEALNVPLNGGLNTDAPE